MLRAGTCWRHSPLQVAARLSAGSNVLSLPCTQTMLATCSAPQEANIMEADAQGSFMHATNGMNQLAVSFLLMHHRYFYVCVSLRNKSSGISRHHIQSCSDILLSEWPYLVCN